MGNTKQLLKTTVKVAGATCVGLGLIGVGAILASISTAGKIATSLNNKNATKTIFKEEIQEVVN